MPSPDPVLFPVLIDVGTGPLIQAVAAYLARYPDPSPCRVGPSLLMWCRDRGLEPLEASRAQIELYVRWMQEVRHFRPSTVSRRVSVMAGFCRTCVIDQVIPASPADYVRRPNVPPESPTLGLSHLQFEALLSASRLSTNDNDFALVVMLGLLGLRIFEACGANINDVGEEHGHRVLKVRGKGGRSFSPLCRPLPNGRSNAPSPQGPRDRSCSTVAAHAWTGTRQPVG